MFLHLLIFHTLIFHPCKFALSLNNETDRLSLIKFKESISSDPYHILDSWNSSTHFCNWHGISWGHKHHRVAQLVLDGYQLFGTISPFIGNLSFLRLIDLDNNNFHGEIPQELGLLFPLQDLYIQNNTLTGEFPINVTNCSNLKLLAFGGNHLIGKIPMEIGSLHNLEGANKISGAIPYAIYNLSSFTSIMLPSDPFSGIKNTSNQFNGSLPANMFINLPNLQFLKLGGNQISGHIPTSIANATKLVMISMGGNNFVGKIPILGKLDDISVLEDSVNSLGSNSSKGWEFLNSLSNCTKLAHLYLEQNDFGGSLPNTIGNLSTQLTLLTLAQNQICGRIPVSLGNPINLMLLDMEMNHFTGIIPISFGNLQKMQELYLLGNKLSGDIFHLIGNLTQLLHLDLSNILEGKVPPSIENCESLQYLDLSQNNFSGVIPIQLITLSSLSILLNLSHNSFGCDIPKEVGKLKNIGKFDFSQNRLIDNIPQTIGDCQSLEYLILQGNFFQETIPLSLASLKSLRYLDLSQNNFSGSIPKGL